jgi:hypothetical protein
MSLTGKRVRIPCGPATVKGSFIAFSRHWRLNREGVAETVNLSQETYLGGELTTHARWEGDADFGQG